MKQTKNLLKALIFSLFFGSAFSSIAQDVQLILTPNSGTPGLVLDVIVQSTAPVFKTGISTMDFGSGITLIKPLVVSNPLAATASIKIDKDASIGQRIVTLKNGNEIISETINGFEVFSPGGANNFRANIALLPIESYNLSDFDVTNPKNQPIIYFVNIYNDNTIRNVKVSIELKTGKYGLVGIMEIKKLSLEANQILNLSNRDFEEFILKGNGSYFLTEIKTKGVFPPDEYEYHLKVEENGIIIADDASNTTVTNPVFNPELIAPGANFEANIEKIYSQFPLFQWFGQAHGFDLALYKLISNQTPEEVIRNVPVYKAQDIKGNNFVYPASAEKLIGGQLYAWQIKARVNTSKGNQYMPSEVFRFYYYNASIPINGDKKPSKIFLFPQEVELNTGDQFQFYFQLLDQDNMPMLNVKPEWKMVSSGGTVDENGVFKAGNSPATVAVLIKYGDLEDYATIYIKPKGVSDSQSWTIDLMINQLFGLPTK